MDHRRIYIAEHDKRLQESLKAGLQHHGWVVRTFDSGYPIVELMDNWPDVFLIDIELPGVNGIEVCKWLKQHDSSRNIPVVLISRESYLKVLAASAQPDDYIEIPFSPRQVAAKINKLLPEERPVNVR